ncbi:WG repeat-containing protein [bacterium]|nr:WG repeat-containing protein [bacterium]
MPTDKTYSNDNIGQGVMIVVRDKKQGLYDVKNQRFLVQPIYDEVWAYHDGIRVVRNENKLGVINENTGILILPIIYDFIMPRDGEKLWILEKNGKRGLWNPLSGKMVYPMEYTEISYTFDKNEELFLLRKGPIAFFCNTKGEKIKKSVIWYHIKIFTRNIIPGFLMLISCILYGHE